VFETLRNFAEIGIAIAGFSGITAAIGSRSLTSWSPAERMQMLSLLETAGLVVFFSLVPQVLNRVLESDLRLWIVSNGLYALTHVAHTFLAARRGRRLAREDPSSAASATRRYIPLMVGGVALIIVQLVVTAVGDLASLEFVYLLVLGWHACVAAIMFGSLILRAFERGAAE